MKKVEAYIINKKLNEAQFKMQEWNSKKKWINFIQLPTLYNQKNRNIIKVLNIINIIIIW